MNGDHGSCQGSFFFLHSKYVICNLCHNGNCVHYGTHWFGHLVRLWDFPNKNTNMELTKKNKWTWTSHHSSNCQIKENTCKWLSGERNVDWICLPSDVTSFFTDRRFGAPWLEHTNVPKSQCTMWEFCCWHGFQTHKLSYDNVYMNKHHPGFGVAIVFDIGSKLTS